MTTTRVVHCKKEPYDVYIGRPGNGEEGPWGNPIPLFNPKDDQERAYVLDAYEEWFRSDASPEARWCRANVHNLAGKVLGCWCAPRLCHGDILAYWADRKAAERTDPDRS